MDIRRVIFFAPYQLFLYFLNVLFLLAGSISCFQICFDIVEQHSYFSHN